VAVVLVVEDEFLIRMNAADLVEQAGHTVIEASNADDAILILESRDDIEIVFSDVQMPGTMDGVRLLRLIRDRWPPIRLILTSGKSLAEDASTPKGTRFLSKPYEFNQVQQALAAQPQSQA
jgi:CheY-like chemotaxis protein